MVLQTESEERAPPLGGAKHTLAELVPPAVHLFKSRKHFILKGLHLSCHSWVMAAEGSLTDEHG